jgi:N-acyl-D-amino-acid deacylase
MYDILIKNGAVIDGTKKARFKADIAISKSKIEAIGDLSSETAYRVIDANGKYVVPGFIDMTNHSDTHWSIFKNPEQESMVRQGITTIVGGLCGSSLAPLVRSTDINSIQKWTDTSEININWLSMTEFLDELKHHKLGINFTTLVGHNTLRGSILGEENRPASEQELADITYMLEKGMKEGAIGISFGLNFTQGRSATNDELASLARVVADTKKLSVLHLRDEGKSLLPSITEIMQIARGSRGKFHISHFKALGREAWGDFPKALNLLRQAQEEGLSITMDVFPYVKTGSLLYSVLPGWAREQGRDALEEKCKDPVERKMIAESLTKLSLHYDRITIAEARNNPALTGKTIKEISESAGTPPDETLVDILRLNDFGVTIFGETIQENDMVEAYKEPYAYFSSDGFGLDSINAKEGGLPHPRSVGATARFLGEYVRNKEIMSWEDAIHKMTLGPANILGLTNRGAIAKGAAADIVVLDPEAISDKATYENPFSYPEGIHWVLVNGTIAVEEGACTQKLEGSIIRA